MMQTFQVMSDGKALYWLYGIQTQDTLTHPVTGDKMKQHPVVLQTLQIKVGGGEGMGGKEEGGKEWYIILFDIPRLWREEF